MSSIITAFVGSLEAAASVLLTVFYGTLAGYLGLVNNKSAVHLSKLAVKLFMPCLLFVNVGSGISTDTILKFTPIISTCRLATHLISGSKDLIIVRSLVIRI